MRRQIHNLPMGIAFGWVPLFAATASAASFDFHGLESDVEVHCDLNRYVVPADGWRHDTGQWGADCYKAKTVIKGRSGEPVEAKLEVWFGEKCGRPEFLTKRSGAVYFDVRAIVPEMIRRIRVRVQGLPKGVVMTPYSEVDLNDSDKRAGASSKTARLLAPESERRWLSIGTREFPVPIWNALLTPREEGVELRMDIALPCANERNWFNTPCIYLDWFDNLDDLLNRHRYGVLETKQDLRAFEERADVPPWVKEMRMWLLLSGRGWKQPKRRAPDMDDLMRHDYSQMVERLKEIATYFDSKKIVVYMPGWEGFYDCTTPRYAPDPEMGGAQGLKRVVDTAHELGYHLVAHFDAWCVSFTQPEFWEVYEASWQQRNPAVGQAFRHMATTNYTSLDHDRWREIFLEEMERAITEYGFDGIHIDQAAKYMSPDAYDAAGPYDNMRGFFLAMHAIRCRHPELLLQFENVCESNLALSPVCEFSSGDQQVMTPLFKKLFYPYIRLLGHLHTSGPHGEGGACFRTPISQEKADSRLHFMRLNDYVPTMKVADHAIDLTTEKSRQYFDWARQYDRKLAEGEIDYAGASGRLRAMKLGDEPMMDYRAMLRFLFRRPGFAVFLMFVLGNVSPSLEAANTTFYVDRQNGDDNNDGTSRATPWQSTAKVSAEFAAGRFGPGDEILFKRNNVWRIVVEEDALRIANCSGTETDPIVIGAYGSGDRSRLEYAGSYKWPKYLVGRTRTDPAANFIVIRDLELKGGYDRHLVEVTSAHHWTLDGLYLHQTIGGPRSTMAIGLFRGGHALIVKNCLIEDIEGEGLKLGDPGDNDVVGDSLIYNTTIRGCRLEDVDFKECVTGVLLYNCKIHDCGRLHNVAYGDCSYVSMGGQHNLMYRCDIGPDEDKKKDVKAGIHLGRYHNSRPDSGQHNTLVRCLIKDIRADGGIAALNADLKHNALRKSTIVNCLAMVKANWDDAITIRNNVFHGYSGSAIFEMGRWEESVVTIEYNLFTSGPEQGTYCLAVAPQFAETVNYTLAADSPCRGAASDGGDLGWWPYGWSEADFVADFLREVETLAKRKGTPELYGFVQREMAQYLSPDGK